MILSIALAVEGAQVRSFRRCSADWRKQLRGVERAKRWPSSPVHPPCAAPSSNRAPTCADLRGVVLEDRLGMFTWVGVAVTMLASPPERGVGQRMSPQVLSPTLVAHRVERTTQARLEGWLTNLAVVRPRGGGDAEAPSAVRLFLAVAPVGKSAGFLAIGTF